MVKGAVFLSKAVAGNGHPFFLKGKTLSNTHPHKLPLCGSTFGLSASMGNTVVLGDVLSVTAHVVRLLDSTVGLKRFTFTVLSTWGAEC